MNYFSLLHTISYLFLITETYFEANKGCNSRIADTNYETENESGKRKRRKPSRLESSSDDSSDGLSIRKKRVVSKKKNDEGMTPTAPPRASTLGSIPPPPLPPAIIPSSATPFCSSSKQPANSYKVSVNKFIAGSVNATAKKFLAMKSSKSQSLRPSKTSASQTSIETLSSQERGVNIKALAKGAEEKKKSQCFDLLKKIPRNIPRKKIQGRKCKRKMSLWIWMSRMILWRSRM